MYLNVESVLELICSDQRDGRSGVLCKKEKRKPLTPRMHCSYNFIKAMWSTSQLELDQVAQGIKKTTDGLIHPFFEVPPGKLTNSVFFV